MEIKRSLVGVYKSIDKYNFLLYSKSDNNKEDDLMSNVVDVAKYLLFSYKNIVGSELKDELMLQKMLYFIQRDNFAHFGREMFEDDFYGWVHGPVIPEMRHIYKRGIIKEEESNNITESDKFIIDKVIREFSNYNAWELRNLSHQEQSWKNSRVGLLENEAGSKVIKKEDILEDAKKVRQFDYLYDMYIDEFDDFDEEVIG